MILFKKIFIYSLSISIISLFLIGLTYTVLIKKPSTLIFLANQLSKNSYNIDYQSVDSNFNFLSPDINFNQITISDLNNKEIFKAENIGLGISLIKTLRKGYVNLNFLTIQNFSYLNNSGSDDKSTLRLAINKVDLKSETISINALDTFVNNNEGNISVVFNRGELNDIPFKQLNIFNKFNSNKIFYSSTLNLDENIIKNENLFNLDAFSEYKINLELTTKGYLDTKSETLKSLNKYRFNESNLMTQTNYSIKKIDLIMHTSIDDSLFGIFNANIPDQDINGSISIKDQMITLRSKLKFEMNEMIDYEEYLILDGLEEFDGVLTIDNNLVSLDLKTDLSKTKITSIIDDLNKDFNKKLITNIKIEDLSNPTYLINNNQFKSYIGPNNNGYFSFGNSFEQQIKSLDFKKGFYIFLTIDKFDINKLSFSNDQINNSPNLLSINLLVEELNFFENIYKDQVFKFDINNNVLNASFSGKDLNGLITTDKTGFTKIEVFDTKFEFRGIDIIESNESLNLSNIKLRFIGKNIQTYDDTFQDIDFYLLRNEKITTIDDITIKSQNFNIGQYNDNDKAYLSYNKIKDLYKVRGSYEIKNTNNLLRNFINYDLEYVSTDLNIQWISLNELKNLEGDIKFLIKGFKSKTSLPDSAFLRALKVFNLNAIFENISNETNIASKNLVINRAEGDFYVGQNRALIKKPIKLETSEANMRWTGEIIKNSDNILEDLNLDLEMRLRVSENIPWYAAIFGGIPALAGGIVFENIFEDSLDDVSTFKFKVKGSVDEPIIERLN